MRKHLRFVPLAALVAASALLANAAPAQAAEPPAAVQKTFDKLLAAVKANDRDAFLADATEALKKATTPQVMQGLNKLGTRLGKGYKATYLCELKQQGYQVHLWKVTFTDGGDDAVIRVPLKDGKVAGFVTR